MMISLFKRQKDNDDYSDDGIDNNDDDNLALLFSSMAQKMADSTKLSSCGEKFQSFGNIRRMSKYTQK